MSAAESEHIYPDSTVVRVYSFGMKGHYGRLFPHHKGIEYFVNGPANSLEVFYAVRKAGQHQAQAVYRYPEVGLAYLYNDFSNPRIFGVSHSVFPYLAIPSLRREHFFQHVMKIGFGLAYFTKKWDSKDNLTFLAIGSHMNACFAISSDFQFAIHESFTFSTSLGFTHFSNGNFRKPNLGMNVFNISAGLQYKFNPAVFYHRVYEPALFCPVWESVVIYSSGVNGYTIYEPGPLWAQSIQFDMGRRWNHKRKIGFGADLFYQESNGLGWRSENEGNQPGLVDKTQLGVHVSYGLIYHRLELNIQLGTYLLAAYQIKPIYNRYAFRYALNESWLAQLSLKAHYGIADFVELGIGYRWTK